MGFKEKILGSEKVFSQLEKLTGNSSFPPLIFWGREGIGKRTTALVFAQSLNCEEGDACGLCRFCTGTARLTHPDVKILFPTMKREEEDGEKKDEAIAKLRRGYSLFQMRPILPKNYSIHIDDVRLLSEEMRFKPLVAKKRVVIVVDADKMASAAANAFLKTLEEPQRDTVFILTTSRLSFLPPTIRSRCFPIYFPPLKEEAIEGYLLKMGYDEKSVKRALVFAYGSLRRAMEFLDDPFPIPEDFFPALLSSDWSSFLELVEDLRTRDIERLIQNLILLFHSQLLKRFNLKDYDSFYPEEFDADELIKRIEALLNFQRELEYNLNRRLFLFSFLLAMRKKKDKIAISSSSESADNEESPSRQPLDF